MKWYVSNWIRHAVKDEKGRAVGTVRRARDGWRFEDAQGAARLCVYPEGGGLKYRVELDGEGSTACVTPGPRGALPLPARAERADFALDGKEARLRQTDRRAFAFEWGDARGSVSGMLGKTAVVEADGLAGAPAALLYILARLMLHEDDIDIV